MYSAGTYNAIIDQPDHCGPFATSLWDLNLLASHYHPSLAKEAASIAADDPSNFSAKPGMVEYLFHAYDPSSGGFNPPIPLPRKHRFEKRKPDKNKLFVRPISQYPVSPFATSVNTRFLEAQIAPPATFTKYFKDLRAFDTRKELFRLKKLLAKHKAYKYHF